MPLTSPVSKRRLARRILVPLLLAGAASLGLLGVSISNYTEQALLHRVRQRSELITDCISFAAETVSHLGELQRLVSALGGTPEVNLIVVVGGQPSRVIASTRHEWLGKGTETLPLRAVREDLTEAIHSGKGRHHSHPETSEFDYSAPLLLTQPELAGGGLVNGAVMIHLDMRPARAEVAGSAWRMTFGSLGALGGLLGLTGWLLQRRILHPIHVLTATIRQRQQGDLHARAQVHTGDEFSELAHSLNEAFAAIAAGEAQLRQQQFALDQHAIVAITDLQGRITYANDRFCAISGYTRAELLGQNHRLVCSGRHPREFFADLYRTIARGQVWHGEICNRAKDGSLYWVDTTIAPSLGIDGKPQHFVAIRTDVTKRRLTEEDLRQANEAAETANVRLQQALELAEDLRERALSASRSKSEFLATMSHEIRTPMNGVIGFTHLLLDSPLNPAQRRYAETIKRSGDALLAIINDILDFSKIEAGKLQIEMVVCDPVQALEDVIGLLAPKAEAKGLALALRCAPNVTRRFRSDPGRLRQILLNLIGNAIKFTGEGHVLVDVRRTPADARAARRGGALRFAIFDTGIGIPPESQGQLFEKFTQADASTTRRFGGTGLGLAICKRLVELMGGEIGLESEVGRGSCFWFTLPLLEVAGPPTIMPPPLPPGHRVLVAVARELPRRLLHDQFQAWHFPCETVASAEEALVKLLEAHPGDRPFGIVVIDAALPFSGEVDLAKAMADHPGLREIPRVYLAAHPGLDSTSRRPEPERLPVLPQPLLIPERLAQVVTTALRRPSAIHAPASVVAPSALPFRADAAAVRPASESASSSAREPSPGPSCPRLRVLLAEDNATNQAVAIHMLTGLGCRVDVAGNGQEAVELALRLPYDLIFMDCHMPEMDGLTAASEIRRRQSLTPNRTALPTPPSGPSVRTPIIALTAGVLEADRAACAAAGMDGFLSKPMSAEDLLEALQRWGPTPP